MGYYAPDPTPLRAALCELGNQSVGRRVGDLVHVARRAALDQIRGKFLAGELERRKFGAGQDRGLLLDLRLDGLRLAR